LSSAPVASISLTFRGEKARERTPPLCASFGLFPRTCPHLPDFEQFIRKDKKETGAKCIDHSTKGDNKSTVFLRPDAAWTEWVFVG
jgi:hypothetical protein